ncbi:unnamed protein product, partial [Clonostachys solani]
RADDMSSQRPNSSASRSGRGTSCFLCHQRKVRCDRMKPCSNCVKAKVECRSASHPASRRRQKPIPKEMLVAQIQMYEKMLVANKINFDPIDPQSFLEQKGAQREKRQPGAMSVEGDSSDDEERSRYGSMSPPFPSHREVGSQQRVHRVAGSSSNSHVIQDTPYRAAERIMRDDSSEDPDNSTLHDVFDQIYQDPTLPNSHLAEPDISSPVSELHPSPVHILQHWQIYLNSIDPLLKVTHVPTVQGHIIKAASQIKEVPKNMEALMFSIYLLTVVTSTEDTVERTFGRSKEYLVQRYHSATHRALINADFMRTDNLILLQAYVLYILSIRWFVDPREVSCLASIAVRLAQRMGCHSDPEQFSHSPFEIEQRRRLWWTIVGHDRRMGETTGLSVTSISTPGNVKLPLNVNDSDLHVHGTEPVKEHTGPTEMVFALTRLEFSTAVLEHGSNTKARSGQKPGGLIKRAGQGGPAFSLDDYCVYVESKYLNHCDPKIPLHYCTIITTRQSFCRIRIGSWLARYQAEDAEALSDASRDMIFLEAIQFIEYDNILQSSEHLQQYRWYTGYHFPFPGYMVILMELRRRLAPSMIERGWTDAIEDTIERAWTAIGENQRLRETIHRRPSFIQVTFGTQFLKAWEAYEEVVARGGKLVSPPSFLYQVREQVRAKTMAEGGWQHMVGPDMELMYENAIFGVV